MSVSQNQVSHPEFLIDEYRILIATAQREPHMPPGKPSRHTLPDHH